MPLSDLKCRAAKPRDRVFKLTDHSCLRLWVYPNGSKHWRVDFRFGGKPKTISLGQYPEVGLAEARQKRDDVRRQLRDGSNPIDVRREKQRSLTQPTWGDIADEYLDKLRREGKASATLKKVEIHIAFAKRRLGNRFPDTIQPSEVLEVARQKESEGKLDTAHRVKQVVGGVFRFGIAKGVVQRDPTVALRGALARCDTQSYPAITDPKELGRLLRAIDDYHGEHPPVTAALRLLPILFTRPTELRAARVQEILLNDALWLSQRKEPKCGGSWSYLYLLRQSQFCKNCFA